MLSMFREGDSPKSCSLSAIIPKLACAARSVDFGKRSVAGGFHSRHAAYNRL